MKKELTDRNVELINKVNHEANEWMDDRLPLDPMKMNFLGLVLVGRTTTWFSTDRMQTETHFCSQPMPGIGTQLSVHITNISIINFFVTKTLAIVTIITRNW